MKYSSLYCFSNIVTTLPISRKEEIIFNFLCNQPLDEVPVHLNKLLVFCCFTSAYEIIPSLIIMGLNLDILLFEDTNKHSNYRQKRINENMCSMVYKNTILAKKIDVLLLFINHIQNVMYVQEDALKLELDQTAHTELLQNNKKILNFTIYNIVHIAINVKRIDVVYYFINGWCDKNTLTKLLMEVSRSTFCILNTFESNLMKALVVAGADIHDGDYSFSRWCVDHNQPELTKFLTLL